MSWILIKVLFECFLFFSWVFALSLLVLLLLLEQLIITLNLGILSCNLQPLECIKPLRMSHSMKLPIKNSDFLSSRFFFLIFFVSYWIHLTTCQSPSIIFIINYDREWSNSFKLFQKKDQTHFCMKFSN